MPTARRPARGTARDIGGVVRSHSRRALIFGELSDTGPTATQTLAQF